MATIYQRPNILFLKGIFKADLEADEAMFDNRYRNDDETRFGESEPILNIRSSNNREYSKIPLVFTTWQQYPQSTNLRCWYCDRSFKNPPLFIVDDITNLDDKRVINPLGNFCSDNCAVKHIHLNYTGHVRDDKLKYQSMLRRERLNLRTIPIIKPALDKTIMVQYCGPDGITPEEYGKRNEELNIDNIKSLMTTLDEDSAHNDNARVRG